MLRKLMVTTAVSGLLLSGALAQSPAPSSPAPGAQNPAPSAQSPAASTQSPAMQAPKTDPMAKADKKATIVPSQKPDQWLASKFKGTDVIGTDDKKLGDVSDILFDKTGKVEAVIVSFGGFLGIGAKDVALSMPSFEVVPAKDGSEQKLKVQMSQEEIKQAADFQPHQPPRPQAMPATRPAPSGGTSPR